MKILFLQAISPPDEPLLHELELGGHEVSIETTYLAAMLAIAEDHPHLVLVDINSEMTANAYGSL